MRAASAWRMARELESFAFLEAFPRRKPQSTLARAIARREGANVANVIQTIMEVFESPASMRGCLAVKRAYSIWRKLQRKAWNFGFGRRSRSA
jgi:(p)ppGpp synthase/HD superfamily hydrolase